MKNKYKLIFLFTYSIKRLKKIYTNAYKNASGGKRFIKIPHKGNTKHLDVCVE